jgi:hypothetical protein
MVVPQFGSPVDGWLAARRLTTLKARSNDGHLHLVTECVIDDSPEDDVRLFVRGTLDQVGGSRDLKQTEVRATGDGE